MPYIGKRISHLRKFKKMTQKSFASKAEVNYRHYQDIEGDKADIRLSTATEIANKLDLPLQTLFDDKLDLDLMKMGLTTSWEILDKVPAGIAITNLEGKILFINSFFKKYLTNLSEADFLNDVFIWELLPHEKQQVGKDLFLEVMRVLPPPRVGHQIYCGPQKFQIQVKVVWNYLRDEEGKIKGFISTSYPV